MSHEETTPERLASAALNIGGSLVSASVLLPFYTDPWNAALFAGIGTVLIFASALGEI